MKQRDIRAVEPGACQQNTTQITKANLGKLPQQIAANAPPALSPDWSRADDRGAIVLKPRTQKAN